MIVLIINYDIEKLRKFLNDFYKITGLTISVWDNELNQLAFQPVNMPDFCKCIKATSLGNKRCVESDKKIIADCKLKNCPVTHKCHAGLADTAIPITVNGFTLGFIMFGQVKSNKILSDSEIEKIEKELKISEKKLVTAYKKLESFEPDFINSAANILKSALSTLYLENYIFYSENEIMDAINNYVNDNIHTPLTVDIICDEFKISRNKLYELYHKRFNTTIGKYILDIRMKKAKYLLLNDDGKIKNICVEIGIPDYNYFSKVFKSYYGISPKDYRKKFPDILNYEL